MLRSLCLLEWRISLFENHSLGKSDNEQGRSSVTSGYTPRLACQRELHQRASSDSKRPSSTFAARLQDRNFLRRVRQKESAYFKPNMVALRVLPVWE